MKTIRSTTGHGKGSRGSATAITDRKTPRPRSEPRSDNLDRLSWVSFLKTMLLQGTAAGEARRLNGQPIAESDSRALHRWLVEGGAISIWRADALLVRYGSHIEEFLVHCQREGLEVWASGREPIWLQEDLSWLDLESSDERWRAEARAQLLARRGRHERIRG